MLNSVLLGLHVSTLHFANNYEVMDDMSAKCYYVKMCLIVSSYSLAGARYNELVNCELIGRIRKKYHVLTRRMCGKIVCLFYMRNKWYNTTDRRCLASYFCMYKLFCT